MRALMYYLSFLLGALRLVFLILSLILFVGVGFLLIKLGLINQSHGFFLRTKWCKIAIRILGIQLHVNGNIDLNISGDSLIVKGETYKVTVKE